MSEEQVGGVFFLGTYLKIGVIFWIIEHYRFVCKCGTKEIIMHIMRL